MARRNGAVGDPGVDAAAAGDGSSTSSGKIGGVAVLSVVSVAGGGWRSVHLPPPQTASWPQCHLEQWVRGR